MWIEGVSTYANIQPFPRIELPDLTVLVGLNGSGKSNLLKAIESHQVTTELTSSNPVAGSPFGTVIRIENSQASPEALSILQDSKISQGGSKAFPADAWLTAFKQMREALLSPFESELNRICAIDEEDVWLLTPRQVAERIAATNGSVDIAAVEVIFDKARAAFSRPENPMRASLEKPTPGAVRETAVRMGKDPLHVTFSDFHEQDMWGSFGIFEPRISQVFGGYRDLDYANIIERTVSEREGGRLNGLSDEEFIRKYGRPPWEQISELMAAFGLPYTVAAPPAELHVPVSFHLNRKSDGKEVTFSSLSSGERVLARFALSVFRFDPHRVNLIVPKILLLDEMDASLHPEMVHRWLDVVNRELVKGRGIKCILTTHSPTTVAVTPEEALFEMVEGIPGPRKVTRQQALNRLTFGLPALSVDYDGRRQVFVESGTDAQAYQQLADVLKAELKLPRTLSFMSTGPKEGKKEKNTGCATVQHIVNALCENGNKSVFGILDWDRCNQGGERIKVLAEGTHYAIENVLLNPLLIGILLLRVEGAVLGTEVKLSEIDSITPPQAQALVDAVQAELLPQSDASDELVPIRFLSGLQVMVRAELLILNGHELETLLGCKIAKLRRFHPTQRGKLVEVVIDKVLKEWRGLTPEPIVSVFEKIANQELA